MLQTLAGSPSEEILQSWPDGRIKMFLTQKVLRFRKEQSELFRCGNYVPVAASGSLAESCVSFIREFEGRWLLVIAPRLSSRVGFPPVGQKWQDTVLELPENLELKNARELFADREISFADRRLNVSDALSMLPFAVVTNAL
jgi:(1->4)-alpha-D-glucan 1-alpha-D-glucosylmutase